MHRLYSNDDISVFWDSDKCSHAKKCVTGSPKTFDPARKPWIDLSRAASPEIWQAVSKCPSGALTCVYNHDITIRLEDEACRSVALDDEKTVGECDYRKTDKEWVIYHTEVLPEYKGKGIGKRLVYSVMEEAERRRIPVIPTCTYAAGLLHAKQHQKN